MKTHYFSVKMLFIAVMLCITVVGNAAFTRRYITQDTTIATTVTWSEDTIIVKGNVTISSTGKLTITTSTNAGKKAIWFAGPYSILVHGNLKAIGKVNDTILFTRMRLNATGDTLGFFKNTITNGGWGGIKIRTSITTDSVLFRYCKFNFIKNVPLAQDTVGGIYLRLGKLYMARCSYSLNNSGIKSNNGISGSINTNRIVIDSCLFYRNFYYYNLNNYFCKEIGLYAITSGFVRNNTFFTPGYEILSNSSMTYSEVLKNTFNIINNYKSNNTCNFVATFSACTTSVCSNTIINNIGTRGKSGMYFGSSSFATCKSNNISDLANSNGIAIMFVSSEGTIKNNTITNCIVGIDCESATTYQDSNIVSGCTGKGVFLHAFGNDTIINCTIKICGKGIEMNTSNADVINSAITNNSNCGFSLQKSSINIINCLIANNYLTAASYGSAIKTLYSTTNIINSTIANNADGTTSAYAPVTFLSSNGDVINSIIYGNTAKSLPNQICITENTVQPSFYNCNIEDSVTGFVLPGITFNSIYSNCPNINPLFTTPSGGAGSGFDALVGTDWSLQASSPLINRGLNSKNNIATDYKGKKRLQNGIIDLGAIETRIAKTIITGPTNITTETRWMNDTVYIKSGNVTITTTGSLSIDPGVLVLIEGNYGIICNNVLKAVGTKEYPVNFMTTSTVNFNSTGSTAGGWYGIRVNADVSENDSTIFKYCNFNYVKGYFNFDQRNKVKIENCLFNYGNYINTTPFFITTENSIVDFNNNEISNVDFNFAGLIKFSNSVIHSYGNFIHDNNMGYISVSQTDLNFFNNRYINNNTALSGQTYNFNLTSSRLSFINNLVTNNKASYIIQSNTMANSIIANNTFSRNTASNDQFFIHNTLVENNIIFNNSDLGIIYYTPFTFRNNYVNTGNSTNCTGCIKTDIDPGFLNPSSNNGIVAGATNKDWHLSSLSGTINKGYADFSDLPSIDLDNLPRVHDNTIDIGPYEHQGSKPAFVTQPVAQELCAGLPLTLSVVPDGLVTFQWQKDGKDIPGKTTHTYTVAKVSPLHQGIYTCKITNGFGTTVSDQASVIVKVPPTVITPESKFVALGSSVAIPVPVTGTDTIYYKWYKSGSANGQTSSTLTIASFAPSDDALYRMEAGNSCDTVSTTQFALNVYPVATITSGSACVAQSITISATTGFSAYQWRKDGVDLAGKTSNSLTIDPLATTDNGIYTCYVGNAKQSTETNPVLLSVKEKPEIVSQPTSALVTAGSDVPLSVAATGTTPFSYQWYKGVTPIGINASSHLVTGFNAAKEGAYSLTITNVCGNDITDAFSLYIEPNITVKNNDTLFCKGENVELNVNANFSSTYQWYKDGIAINSATTNKYTRASVALSDAGSYYCLVTSAYGVKATNSKTILVSEAPEIALHPSSQWALTGSTFDITTTATGTSPLTYQWYKNAGLLGSGSRYIITNFHAVNDTGRYYCKVTNLCGTVNSNIAYLYTTPIISLSPNNSSPCEGTNLTLDATAGLGATYQWYKDGAVLSGKTSVTLTLTGIKTSDAGNYSCLVTKSGQSKSTETRTISVQSAPQIVVQPLSQWTTVGSNYSLEISTVGSAPITYQWYKDAGLQTGKTSSSQSLSNFQSTDQGTYYCTATNTCGTATSANAYLYVSPTITVNINNGHSIPCKTDNVTLDASSGTGSTYKWYKDGVATGQTTAIISFTGIGLSDAGNYYCDVTRSGLTKQTETRSIGVLSAPEILSQPASQWTSVGTAYSLEIVTSGSNPINYQWYKDAALQSGKTTNNWTLANFQVSDEGVYFCTATNACGTATSSNAYMTVNPKITLTINNGHTIPCEADNVELDAATGSATYKWFKDGAATGQTTAKLTLTGITQENAGNYYCEVTRNGLTKQTETRNISVQTAPEILVQPASQWTTATLTYTLDVSVAGTKPINYQWYKAPTTALGTSSTQTLANFQASNEGVYYCTVNNVCGNKTSSNANMYLSPRITLVNNSGHSVFCEGDNASLNAFAGTGATYQWYKDGVSLLGKTSSSLSFPNVTTGDEGSYYCEVTIGGLIKQTDTRVVSMQTKPEIVAHPLSQWVASGKTYNIEVAVLGSKPLTYQWYKGADPILSGGDLSRYNIASFASGDEALYKCKVDNVCGTTTSNEGYMYITPSISLNKAAACEGETNDLNVTAASGATFVWYKDGNAIGNTTSSVHFASLNINDEGSYSCQVTISGQTKSTDVKSIFVQSKPEILLTPTPQWVALGAGYSLEVTVQGSKPINFKWYKDASEIIGQTSSKYDITNMQTSNEGTYYCVINNACGTVQTSDAYVYLYPSITLTNKGHAVPCEADTSVLTVTAGGNVTYQWFKDGNSIANTTSILNLDSLTRDDEGIYYCQITRGGQSKATSSKTITVQTAPEILLSPASQWANIGETYSLEVSSLGTKPLNYQWYKESSPVGDNTSSYILANFSTSHEGTYKVKVSNYCGIAESENAYVYITPRMTVTNPNGKPIPCDGDTVIFNAFSGAGATYQWYKDGNAIADSTRSQLFYKKMSKETEGTYYCKVSRSTFSKATESKIVFVAYAPEIFVQPTSQWVPKDGSTTLELAASGSKPLTYQWLKNSTAVGGSDTRFAIAGIKASDEGIYKCQVSNSCGVLTSSSVFVYIDPQIVMTNNNNRSVLCEKDGVTLDASSGALATYQWYREGNAIDGSTNAMLSFTSLTLKDVGNYYCMVTKGQQKKASESRVISLQIKPEILVQPQSQWIVNNGSYDLNVVASGTKPLKYVWTKDNNKLADTISEIDFETFSSLNEGNYICTVSNACGNAPSLAANLRVAPELSNPTGSSVCENDTFELNVVFSDVAKYQWLKDGKVINNVTEKSLRIAKSSFNDIGTYQCQVSNLNGYVILGPMQLTLRKAPSVETLMPITYVNETFLANIKTKVAGDEPIKYQWFKDGTLIANQNSANFIKKDAGQADEALYKCFISNSCGDITTNETKLVMAPQICMVTNAFELDSNKNMLVWDRNSKYPYSYFNIYREGYIRDKYVKIGQVPYKAITAFIDSSVNPKSQAFVYKITAVDANGVETDINATAQHKTIHLLVTQGIPKGIQLDWDEYIGFDYSTYTIYRSVGTQPFDSLYSMSSTSRTYTDFDAPVKENLRYFVSVRRNNPCAGKELNKKAGAGPFAAAVSNMEDNSRIKFAATDVEMVDINDFGAYPNPFSNYSNLKYTLGQTSVVRIVITDFAGREIKTIVKSTQSPGTYSYKVGDDLQVGIYFIKLHIDNNTLMNKLLKIR
jgi:hypothetical protein